MGKNTFEPGEAVHIACQRNNYQALYKLVKRHRQWLLKNPQFYTTEERDWARQADKVLVQIEDQP